ncbi:TPA: hypothetical protein QEM72_005398 [Pseudomonas putida]|nr:hypothetical protein [Pseudomonas putida]
MSADAVRMFGTGLLDQMNAGRLPAFAGGGGVGESGPQLQITRPSQIHSRPQAQVQAAGAPSNAETLAELRAIRERLDVLNEQSRETRKNTEQLAQVGTQIIGTPQVKVMA